ncbi:hypothetical protein SELMODRAFT_424795 [Selaginella moellendorffii]|uniref:Uncharacterized protein n=1 Tax=Selaginella moellendorffii TaxID=88036 RepID=D8SR18_SELML|nr:hypothetical protein SELMODRAFT_424795 [Selaginella moellendorffii]
MAGWLTRSMQRFLSYQVFGVLCRDPRAIAVVDQEDLDLEISHRVPCKILPRSAGKAMRSTRVLALILVMGLYCSSFIQVAVSGRLVVAEKQQESNDHGKHRAGDHPAAAVEWIHKSPSSSHVLHSSNGRVFSLSLNRMPKKVTPPSGPSKCHNAISTARASTMANCRN